jgi:hypothetical protein
VLDAASVEPDLALVSWYDADRLFRVAREALVRVDQPVVLVPQLQRSGGTLVNTLLDGHPQLHAHPYELQFDTSWPALDLAAGVDDWIEALREGFIVNSFERGYLKLAVEPDDHPVLPFTIAPSFLERLFRLVCADEPPQSQRQVLDRYLTAFFNAWIDCQGLREPNKLWVTAFAPGHGWGESRTRFFADYPDGRFVFSHRDPRGWYASASTWHLRYVDLSEAIQLWRRNAEEILAAKAERPRSVFVLTYDALVGDPARTMEAVAHWLGIEWNPILLQPTFNRLPTEPNSSFDTRGTGVRRDSLDRWRDVLAAETVATIEAETADLDAAVRAIADAG